MPNYADRWRANLELENSGLEPHEAEGLLLVADDLIGDSEKTYGEAIQFMMDTPDVMEHARGVANQIRPSSGILGRAGEEIGLRVRNIPASLLEMGLGIGSESGLEYRTPVDAPPIELAKKRKEVIKGLPALFQPETLPDPKDWQETVGSVSGSFAALVAESILLKKVSPSSAKAMKWATRSVADALKTTAIFAVDEKLKEGHVSSDAVFAGMTFGAVSPFKWHHRAGMAAGAKLAHGIAMDESPGELGFGVGLFGLFALLPHKEANETLASVIRKMSRGESKLASEAVTWSRAFYEKAGRWPTGTQLNKKFPSLKLDDQIAYSIREAGELELTGAGRLGKAFAAKLEQLKQRRPPSDTPAYRNWVKEVDALKSSLQDAPTGTLKGEARGEDLHTFIESLPTVEEVTKQEGLIREGMKKLTGAKPTLKDEQITRLAFDRARQERLYKARWKNPRAYGQWWEEQLATAESRSPSAAKALEEGVGRIAADPTLQRIAARARFDGRDVFIEGLQGGTAEKTSTFILREGLPSRSGVKTFEVMGEGFKPTSVVTEAEFELLVRSANARLSRGAGGKNIILTAKTGVLEAQGLEPFQVSVTKGVEVGPLQKEAAYLTEKGYTPATFFEASEQYYQQTVMRRTDLTPSQLGILLGSRFGPAEAIVAAKGTPDAVRTLGAFSKRIGAASKEVEAALPAQPHSSPIVAAHEFSVARGAATPLKPTLEGFTIPVNTLLSIHRLRPEMRAFFIKGTKGKVSRIVVFGPRDTTTEVLHSVPKAVWEPRAKVPAAPHVTPVGAKVKLQKPPPPSKQGLFVDDPTAKKIRSRIHRYTGNKKWGLKAHYSDQEARIKLDKIVEEIFPDVKHGMRDLSPLELEHLDIQLREFTRALRQGRKHGFSAMTFSESIAERSGEIAAREKAGAPVQKLEKARLKRDKGIQEKGVAARAEIPQEGPVDTIDPESGSSLVDVIQHHFSGLAKWRPVIRVLDGTTLMRDVLKQDAAQEAFTQYFNTRARDLLKPWLKWGKSARAARDRIGGLLEVESKGFNARAGKPLFDLGVVTQEEANAAKGMRELFDLLAVEFGIPSEQKILNYLHHMFDRRFASMKLSADLRASLPKELMASFKKPRIANADDFVWDVARVFDHYLRLGARDKFMNPLLERYGEKWLAKQPVTVQPYIRDYLKDLAGVPTDALKADPLVKCAESFLSLSGMKHVAQKFYPHLDPRAAAEQMTQSLVGSYRTSLYSGGLGWKVSSALKNLTQNLQTIGEVGLIRWAKDGVAMIATEEGQRLIAEAQIYRGYMPLQYKSSQLLNKGLQQLIQKTMFMFEGADRFNRGVAYLAAYRRFIATQGKFDLSTSLKTQRAVIKQHMEVGDLHKAAMAYGRDVVWRTQYLYSKVNTPRAFRSPTGQVYGTFLTWPINYGHLLNDWIVSGFSGGDGFRKLARYTLSAGLVSYAGNKYMDTDISSWFGGGAFPTGFPPGPTAMIDLTLLAHGLFMINQAKLAGGDTRRWERQIDTRLWKYWDKKKHRPGPNFWVFVPTGLFWKQVIRATEATERGDPDEAIRELLGLRSKKKR